MTALLDSNVLIAYRLERDQYHDRAAEIVRGVDAGDLPNVAITDFCLAETLNILGERIGHDHAVATLDAVQESRGIDTATTVDTDVTTGQALFRRYEGLSYVDAISVAVLQRRNGEYCYSFDDDFDAVPSVTRLDAPVDPTG